MIYRNFGNNGLKVSAIGFGAGQIGDYKISEKQIEYLLNSVLDFGINLIDTACGYYAEAYWLRWKEMNLPEQEDWQDTFIRFSAFAEGVDSAIIGKLKLII
ncbi:MAG: hypothetical protein MUO34_06445 [Ignavibacteriaceae bacterium]|nr:hypothetical protein [Ignavibacteriaceae bacterium]